MTTRSVAFLSMLLASALMSLVLSHSALAQDAPIKIELTPATVDLPAKGEAQTQLILRNKSQGELQNVKLDWFSGTKAVITADGSKELAKLPPQADTYWTLHLSQGANGLIPGNVHFRVSYNTRGAAAAQQVLYAPLAINSAQSNEVNSVVEVVTHTSSTQLNEQRPGQVFLVVNNKSNLPLRLGKITASGPGFISGRPDMSGLSPDEQGLVQIGARDSVYVPVQIEVTDTVRPGKHTIIFQVPVEWGAAEHLQKANVIAKQEFDVGILGESDLLTALGLPSFLILPGFLILVTYRLLSRGEAGEESILKDATNPALWVGAITLSGVMAFLYPYGTKLLGGVSRNYLIGYGLGDIIRVWLASILIGLLAWAAVWIFRYVRRWLFMPAATDGPASLLKKLYWQGLNVSLNQMVVKIGAPDQNQTLFLVERRRDGQESYWVAPYINIEWLAAATAEFKASVASQLEDDGSAYRLAGLIEQGERDQMLRASWDQATTGLNGPREVKKAEVVSDPLTSGVIAKQL